MSRTTDSNGAVGLIYTDYIKYDILSRYMSKFVSTIYGIYIELYNTKWHTLLGRQGMLKLSMYVLYYLYN